MSLLRNTKRFRLKKSCWALFILFLMSEETFKQGVNIELRYLILEQGEMNWSSFNMMMLLSDYVCPAPGMCMNSDFDLSFFETLPV